MCNLKKGNRVKIWSDDYFLCGEEGVIMDDKKNNTSGREILIEDNNRLRIIHISENDLEKV
jgi:hypothetical protein